MKTLQNNYTTPEQSKRLLELGVPADCADCYLTRFGIDEDWEVKVLNNIKYCELEISNQDYCLPCWSVGRLIEIYTECIDESKGSYIIINKNFVMDDILYRITEDFDYLDFSKLED